MCDVRTVGDREFKTKDDYINDAKESVRIAEYNIKRLLNSNWRSKKLPYSKKKENREESLFFYRNLLKGATEYLLKEK